MTLPALRLTDFEPSIDDPVALRVHRRRRLVLGYRLFGALGWGSLGDGHISARDPIAPDHFWLGRYGAPFGQMTLDDLVLVAPDGTAADEHGNPADINPAAYFIHWPVHEARPDIVCAAHTHTPYGTPFAAIVEPILPISQESCAFHDDHSIFDDDELDIVSLDGGKRIGDALGANKAVVLRNHGLLTVGPTIDEALGWFVMLERVAEVQVKAGARAKPISAEAAAVVHRSVGGRELGWHQFQWLLRSHRIEG
jgi:ribulose-5-phosphate 4-epimerase/fuculose-1-phosphate aldolase